MFQDWNGERLAYHYIVLEIGKLSNDYTLQDGFELKKKMSG